MRRNAVRNEAAAEWTRELESGRTTSSDIVVSAIGMFNDVAVPDPSRASARARVVRHVEGRCHDYYRTPNGRIVTQWPHSMPSMEEVLSTLDEEAYEVAARGQG